MVETEGSSSSRYVIVIVIVIVEENQQKEKKGRLFGDTYFGTYACLLMRM
jgi:hypothetical protein